MRKMTTMTALVLFAATFALQAQVLKPADDFPASVFIVSAPESAFDYGAQAVVGDADFEKMRDYPTTSALYKLSRKIGAVFIGGRPACTGSLVGPDLFLTNEHCAFSEGQQIPLSEYLFSFDYYVDDLNKVARLPIMKATELVKYNKSLDYALYRLDKQAGNELGWLRIEDNDRLLNASSNVKIIQHPSGRSKEIALKNSRLYKAKTAKGVVHYFADTEPGSSGSPVFSSDGDSIVALHHAGYSNKGKGIVNEGILASKIYAEIGQYLPAGSQPRTAPSAPQQPAVPDRSRNRTAPAPPPQQAEPPSGPAPARPKQVDCKGKGMSVTDEKGNVKCVKW